MKKVILTLCMLLALFVPVYAQEEETTEDALLGATSQIEQTISLPSFHFSETAKEISEGKWSVNFKDLINGLVRLFLGELFNGMNILIKIVVIAIMAGILCNMQNELGSEGIDEVSFLVCYIIIAGLSVSAFAQILDIASSAIDNLLLLMQTLVPILIGIIASGGGAISSATLSPSLFVCMQVITYISKNTFLPLILILTALSVINHMTSRFHITKLIDLGRQLLKWGAGILLTIFVGVLGLQGFTSAFADGVAGKTVKYAISSFVPLVGGLLSDSVEAVLCSTTIVKNAVGVTGMIALLSVCISPLVKLFAISILYRFAAGVTEPVTDKRITGLLSDLASNITHALIVLLMVCVMFVISIGMLCLVTNIPMMMK